MYATNIFQTHDIYVLKRIVLRLCPFRHWTLPKHYPENIGCLIVVQISVGLLSPEKHNFELRFTSLMLTSYTHNGIDLTLPPSLAVRPWCTPLEGEGRGGDSVITGVSRCHGLLHERQHGRNQVIYGGGGD